MPAVVAATEPTTYVANIVRTVNAYKVTFLNYDQTELWWTNVDYGETPIYEGPAPVRQSANGYRYEFSGWTPAIVPVTGIASYTADYDEIAIVSSSSIEESSSSEEPSSSAESSSSIVSSVSADIVISGDLVQTVVKGENFKTVTFSNVESYDRGQWEIYWIEFEKSGDKLFVRQNQYQSTEYVNVGNWTEYFTINGIDYEIKAALVEPGSSSSSGESSSSAQTFTVTFVDDDGTTVLLAAREYAEGTAAASIVKPSNPTKDATAEYTYTFSAWTPNIGAVTADATYKAKYTATKRKYTITFENGDGTRSTSTVEYGKMPTAPAAKLPGNNAQFSYSVVGWTPDIVAVTGNATYTLEYAATVNEYTITFLNYNNTELQSSLVAYGTLPEYTGADPTRDADENYTYTFVGWTPSLASVTREASYTATFSQEAIVPSSSSVVESSGSEEESSSSVEESSSSDESSSSEEESSSSAEESPCIAFVNGQGGYGEHCYNSGLTEMAEGVCYTLNPERASDIKWVGGSATDGYWWTETSCEEFVPTSSNQNSSIALDRRALPKLSVSLSGRTLMIEGGQASVEVFDLQGRPLARFTQVSGAVELVKLNSGSYILRIKSGTQVQNRKITLK